METILQHFNWAAMAIASIGVALTVVVVNQTSPGQKIHNAKIALVAAFLFSIFVTEWEGFAEKWQAICLQVSFTFLVACIIGFTRYQDVVDVFIGNLLAKASIKKEPKENDDARA